MRHKLHKVKGSGLNKLAAMVTGRFNATKFLQKLQFDQRYYEETEVGEEQRDKRRREIFPFECSLRGGNFAQLARISRPKYPNFFSLSLNLLLRDISTIFLLVFPNTRVVKKMAAFYAEPDARNKILS